MRERTVVVTGGAGYLGSVLIPLLIEEGYKVRVIDRFFFGRNTLPPHSDTLEHVVADARWYNPELLQGAYGVLDLVALSNDPLGALDPERTMAINHKSRVRTAIHAKRLGVRRYILASSCSVYGFHDGLIDETAAPDPLSTYAKANLLAEQDILPLHSEDFNVTVLRQGTLFGYSPRMRNDLVVNAMTSSLRDQGVIQVQGGGRQWRPLMHVYDSARAFLHMLKDDTFYENPIFNAGGSEHNYRIIDIAQSVIRGSGILGEVRVEKETPDARSYSVSCDKIAKLGYQPVRTIEGGVKEIIDAYDTGLVNASLKLSTIGWYQHLLEMYPNIFDEDTSPHLADGQDI